MVPATPIPSSLTRPHTYFTQIFYHTSFASPELKSHPNSLHSLTYKLYALQPQFSLRLPPSSGCVCQGLHPPDTSGHCSWVQQPCVCIQQQPLAPAWGSRMAGSHRLERGCNYHLQGLKLGEGHGRPGVQSLLWRRVSVAPCATGKVTVPTPSLSLLHLSFLFSKIRRVTRITN